MRLRQAVRHLSRVALPRRRGLVERFAGPPDELVRLLFEDGAAGMLVVDRQASIVRANATLRRWVARRVSLDAGQPAAALFQENWREQVAHALRQALEGRTSQSALTARLETSQPDSDHTVELAAMPLREAHRGIGGALLHLREITQERRLEAQLAQSQKLQAVGQLAGGIAHDFNNLLTAITGAAEFLQNRSGHAPQALEDIEQIRRSAERGAALVRQLLAFSRRQTLEPRIIPINQAIEDISRLLTRFLGGNVRLRLELEEPGRTVRVDPTQLDQVLMNLAVNARDAMAEGGTLTLRTGHVTLYRPRVEGPETILPGRYVMIEAEDTGTGIPADILPRIFDPFFTTKRERGGSGLGLSTVHGIIRQSDGFIGVESEAGRGTRMRVYLPRHAEEDTVVAEPPRVEPAPAQPAPLAVSAVSRAILLVDDEVLVLRLAERALIQRGWRVLSAESGDAALAMLRDAPECPALLVSDVVMPGMSGPALVRAARAEFPQLPAILVSGYAEEALREELANEQVSFLAKPYSLKALVAEVDRVAVPPASVPSSVAPASTPSRDREQS